MFCIWSIFLSHFFVGLCISATAYFSLVAFFLCVSVSASFLCLQHLAICSVFAPWATIVRTK